MLDLLIFLAAFAFIGIGDMVMDARVERRRRAQVGTWEPVRVGASTMVRCWIAAPDGYPAPQRIPLDQVIGRVLENRGRNPDGTYSVTIEIQLGQTD
jgi:hypothetical protein